MPTPASVLVRRRLRLVPVVLGAALGAGLPASAQKPSGPVWVKDATKASPPKGALTGSLSGSPITVRKAVWRREQQLAFSDAPLDVMMLEVQVRTTGTPKVPKIPGFKAPKGPTDGKFLISISQRQGTSVAGKRFVHQINDKLAAPESATPEKPALMGVEVGLGDMGTMAAPFTMVLEFGPRRGAVQPGTIYLCLEDGDKSFVAGSFEAVVK